MRFPTHLATVLRTLGINAQFVASEIEAMSEAAIAKTADRRVLGTMNEFAFLADGYREYLESPDLLMLSLKLSSTPSSPLRGAVLRGLWQRWWQMESLMEACNRPRSAYLF